MKPLGYLTCFAGAAALACAQDIRNTAAPKGPAAPVPTLAADVKVPDRTLAQKYKIALQSQTTQIGLGMAFAKSRGISIGEYAQYCGDEFASAWNTQRGFAGFAAGVLSNYDLNRAEDDPPIQILVQNDSTVRLKAFVRHLAWVRTRKNYRITADELMRWWDGCWQRIALRYGCTYAQEVTDGDYLIVTITKNGSGNRTALAP
jgi:hypothetical protein